MKKVHVRSDNRPPADASPATTHRSTPSSPTPSETCSTPRETARIHDKASTTPDEATSCCSGATSSSVESTTLPGDTRQTLGEMAPAPSTTTLESTESKTQSSPPILQTSLTNHETSLTNHETSLTNHETSLPTLQTLPSNHETSEVKLQTLSAGHETTLFDGRSSGGRDHRRAAGQDKGSHRIGFSTLSVHAGESRQKPVDSITDPIVCASTFTFANTQGVLDYIEQQQPRGEYARYGTPGEAVVERKLAALDGAEDAVLFASGMAALVGLLTAKLSAGDEVIFFDQCYHRSREFCTRHLARFGVVTHTVKTGDYTALERAITDRTRLLISESPTNPHLSIVDLELFVAIGRRHQVETLIDATLATPYNVRPIEFGVDYVLHSATKYLGGHNDLLAGVVCGSREKLADVRGLRGIMGAINSPHNVYLLERGLKTFELRMQRHNQNGQRVAEFLESHPSVSRVLYPGLPSHPDHGLARRTMRGFGGLITFELRDADWRQTADVVDAAKLARIAPSLGGVESLIEQPLVMSYFKYSPEDRKRFGISDNMIRLACGIENTEDLIADLDQSLSGLRPAANAIR